MKRKTHRVQVTIPINGHLSGAFYFSPYAMGDVHMPDEWTAASIGFHVSTTRAGTFRPKKDATGDLMQIAGPVADEAYGFPPEMAGSFWVKLWSQDGTGGDVSQEAARVIELGLKA